MLAHPNTTSNSQTKNTSQDTLVETYTAQLTMKDTQIYAQTCTNTASTARTTRILCVSMVRGRKRNGLCFGSWKGKKQRCFADLFYSSFVCVYAYANVYFKTPIIKQNIKRTIFQNNILVSQVHCGSAV